MARLIGVSIGRNKRIYFFDEGNNTLKIGDNVIVETKIVKSTHKQKMKRNVILA